MRLHDIRAPRERRSSPGGRMLTACILFLAGALAGVLSKLLDIYTTNLGNLFSAIAVWVLLGTVISVYSATPRRAALHVFLFCIGMLAAYYLTAEWTGSVYSRLFIHGWIAFSFLSPVFAVLTWYAKGRGAVALMLKLGIPACTVLMTILLFDRLRGYDLVIVALEAVVLFKKEKWMTE